MIAGFAGGGSFGIFVSFTTPPATVPLIENNEIILGTGGAGGTGGIGGIGGIGRDGGPGGLVNPSSIYLCMEPGSNGGDGGNGGHGAGAGGSCGGVSYGIFSSGHDVFDLNAWSSGNVFATTGLPGQGGFGGYSVGNFGDLGLDGTQSNTNFP